MSKNLWPVDFGVVTEQTPVGILREQGDALGQRTGNIVVGRVDSNRAQPGIFTYTFNLYFSPLSYQFPLLHISHGIELYPVDISIEGKEGEPSCPSTRKEFSEEGYNTFFRNEEVKKVIASLIAQSKQ